MAGFDPMTPALALFTEQSTKCRLRPSFLFAVEIHTAGKSVGSGDMIFVKDLAVFRDHEDNFADVVELSLSIPMGVMMYDIYDSLENLEITLNKTTQFFDGDSKKQDAKAFVSTYRYKAIFLQDKNKALPTSRSMSRSDMNQQLPMVVVFQLVDKASEALRLKTTGGSFSCGVQGVKQSQLLQTIFSTEVNKILVDGKPPIDMLTVKPSDNTDVVKNIVLPSNKRLVELPDYLQEKLGGVYGDGLSLYTQRVCIKPGDYKTHLSIFSLYNPGNGDDKTNADSILYCIDESSKVTDKVGVVHNKYDKGIYVLAHKLTGIDDTKGVKTVNTGTGFRMTDASKIMDAPVTYKPGGAEFNRAKTNTEIIGENRADGANFAVHHGVGSNPFALTTDVFKRSGVYVTVQVSNSDHDLFGLGHKFEICYMSNTVNEQGESIKKLVRRRAYILQLLTAYTNAAPDLIANSNSAKVELTSHTTLKMIVGQIIAS